MESCLVSADTSSGGGSGGSTAPTVQSVTPTNSATSIAVGDNITVTFSEAMQSSTIDNTTVTLTSSGSNVTSTVSYSSNVATINCLNKPLSISHPALFSSTIFTKLRACI